MTDHVDLNLTLPLNVVLRDTYFSAILNEDLALNVCADCTTDYGDINVSVTIPKADKADAVTLNTAAINLSLAIERTYKAMLAEHGLALPEAGEAAVSSVADELGKVAEGSAAATDAVGDTEPLDTNAEEASAPRKGKK